MNEKDLIAQAGQSIPAGISQAPVADRLLGNGADLADLFGLDLAAPVEAKKPASKAALKKAKAVAVKTASRAAADAVKDAVKDAVRDAVKPQRGRPPKSRSKPA